MKAISINGRRFLYKTKEWASGELTIFYHPEPFKTLKFKYLFFGPKVEKNIYKEAFCIYFNIENPIYTKQEVRDMIEQKIIVLDRKKEIEKGEII